LVGIKRIIELEHHVEALRRRVGELESELYQAHGALRELGLAREPGAELVLRDRTSMVVWQRRQQRGEQSWR
jgi:hypothetical protein